MEHTVAQREPTLFEISLFIKDKQLEVLEIEKKLAELKENKTDIQKRKQFIEESYWQKVAFDKELKNETQRKSKLKELLSSDNAYPVYEHQEKQIEKEISNTIYELKKQQIELDFLKRLYEIKLTYEAKKQEV